MEIVKKTIFNAERNMKNKFILIGDSYYDYKCAKENGIKFIFASDWSDIKKPKELLKIKILPLLRVLNF